MRMLSTMRVPATPILFAVMLLVLAGTAIAQDDGNQSGNAASESTGSAEQSGQTDPLVSAYQREFVFLDNEIRLLEQRLEEVRSNGEQRVSNAEQRLENRETELLRLNQRVSDRQEELRVLEEEAASARQSDTGLEQVSVQGTSRLEEYGVQPFSATLDQNLDDLSDDERMRRELEYVFNRAFDTLTRIGRIHTTQGRFFLSDGQQVSGTIVNVGRIASFGVGENSAGTLAPAGGGELQLVDRDSAAVARALARTGPGAVADLPIFLYEGLEEAAQFSQGQSFRETVEASGVIGLVIIGIGAFAVLFIVLRTVSLVILGRGSQSQIGSVAAFVQAGNFEDAYTRAKKLPGALGRVLATTVRGLQKDPSNVEDLISESVLNEQPGLDRFRTALQVFAAVAPLLGLLGTVTGMIATFDIITVYGTGDPGLLSGGISEALITTEFGLAVAIPTLLIGNLLASWSDRVTSNLEVSALRLVNVSAGYESAATEKAKAQ